MERRGIGLHHFSDQSYPLYAGKHIRQIIAQQLEDTLKVQLRSALILNATCISRYLTHFR
jgi:hypothetical protein